MTTEIAIPQGCTGKTSDRNTILMTTDVSTCLVMIIRSKTHCSLTHMHPNCKSMFWNILCRDLREFYDRRNFEPYEIIFSYQMREDNDWSDKLDRINVQNHNISFDVDVPATHWLTVKIGVGKLQKISYDDVPDDKYNPENIIPYFAYACFHDVYYTTNGFGAELGTNIIYNDGWIRENNIIAEMRNLGTLDDLKKSRNWKDIFEKVDECDPNLINEKRKAFKEGKISQKVLDQHEKMFKTQVDALITEEKLTHWFKNKIIQQWKNENL